MPTRRRSPRLSRYARTLLAAMVRRTHGETTREEYLSTCEYVSAVHNRTSERAEFARLLAAERSQPAGA